MFSFSLHPKDAFTKYLDSFLLYKKCYYYQTGLKLKKKDFNKLETTNSDKRLTEQFY